MRYFLSPREEIPTGELAQSVLYEDETLLLCVKPGGLSSEPTADGRGFPDVLCRLPGREGQDLRTVHRLDQPVGGLFLLAKGPAAAAALTKLMRERKVRKSYLAVVYGKPAEESGRLEDLLFRDGAKGKTYVVKRFRRGVREASLRYTCLSTVGAAALSETERSLFGGGKIRSDRPLSLLRIELETGRTHQIRVQFASRQMPLVGDGRYGSGDGGEYPALWAWRLEFAHPADKRPMVFAAPPPPLPPFSLFAALPDAPFGFFPK